MSDRALWTVEAMAAAMRASRAGALPTAADGTLASTPFGTPDSFSPSSIASMRKISHDPRILCSDVLRCTPPSSKVVLD